MRLVRGATRQREGQRQRRQTPVIATTSRRSTTATGRADRRRRAAQRQHDTQVSSDQNWSALQLLTQDAVGVSQPERQGRDGERPRRRPAPTQVRPGGAAATLTSRLRCPWASAMGGALRGRSTRNGPIASASAPERRNTSTASAGEHTSGSPWMLKLVFSTAPTPQRARACAQQRRQTALRLIVGHELRPARAVDADHARQAVRDARRHLVRHRHGAVAAAGPVGEQPRPPRSRACSGRTADTTRAA